MDNVHAEFHQDLNINRVNETIDSSLFNPVKELLEHTGKRIREKMVYTGFYLSQPNHELLPNETQEKQLQIIAEIVESIHTGSLVIDDIQDGSQFRRGKPSLYKSLGIPQSINVGNFLYFWPMKWVDQLKLDQSQELALFKSYFQMMTNAHLGQSIDLGTSIDSIEAFSVPSLCMKSLELKTGELMAMAIEFGAILGGATTERRHFLREFGNKFGIALQCYDDIGNLTKKQEAKYLEDLILKRPSFVWVAASHLCSSAQYSEFLILVRKIAKNKNNKSVKELEHWLEKLNFITSATKEADEICCDAFRILERKAKEKTFVKSYNIARSLCERIKNAYR